MPKKVAPVKAGQKKGDARAKKVSRPAPLKKVSLFKSTPKNFGIGQNIPPARDLTRFVKWPRYVRLQRQRRVLYQRLKTPPAINQFTHTADVNTAKNLFILLNKYRPEDRQTKKIRLLNRAAEGGKQGQKETGKKPVVVKYGINHVTALIENKKAKLVVIAHDVDPIELVLWLPALCRKLEVPYLVVKGKSRLGQVVHKKTATALVITDVKKEDAGALAQLVAYAKDNFNNNMDIRRQFGGGKVGVKSRAVVARRVRVAANDAKKKEAQATAKAAKAAK